MMLYPIGQLIFDAAVLSILSTGMEFPSLILMVMGAIPGLVGDVSGLSVMTSAYVVDITTKECRTLRMNLLEASTMLAGFSATISSGYIIERFGFHGIYINLSLLVLAFLYLVFFMKPLQRLRNPGNECQLDEEPCGNITSKNERNSYYLTKEPNSMEKKEGNGLEEASYNKVSKETSEEFHKDEGFRAGENVCLTTSAADDRKAAKPKCKISLEGIVLNVEDNKNPGEEDERDATDHGSKKDDIDEIRNDAFVESAEINIAKECNNTENIFDTLMLKISNPIRNFKRVFRTLKANGNLRYGLALFFLVMLLSFSYSVEMAVTVFYIISQPYFFESREIGLFLAFESALLATLALVTFNYLFTKIIKMNDQMMLAVTSAAYVVYYVLLEFSNSKLMLYSIQILHAVATLNLSIIQAVLSKTIPKSSTAVIFSALLMIETGSVLIAAVISPIAYAKTAALHPGTVFFVLAIAMLVSCSVSSILLFVKRTQERFCLQ